MSDERREALHTLLKTVDGVSEVYFQAPPSKDMVYPCIIYRRDTAETDFADNNVYGVKKRYLITVIDRNPDSEIPKQVAALPTCVFDRFYVADGLNHDVYKLFF